MGKVLLSHCALLLVCVACTRPPAPPGPTAIPVVSPTIPAPQGTTSSGGGSPYKGEFKDIGRTVVRRLRANRFSEVAGVSADAFEKTLEGLEVEVTEALLYKDGSPVDALNFPSEHKVLLSLVRWAPFMHFGQKRRLVVHEVFGLMEKADAEFERTDELLAKLRFLDEVDIYEFQVGGDAAKTLTEKFSWRADEITVDNQYPKQPVTYYAARRGTHPHTGALLCRKHENWETEDYFVSYFCHIIGQAKASEQGTIVVSLGPWFTKEQEHPLWRFFDGHQLETFDYGPVKGDSRYQEIELFP